DRDPPWAPPARPAAAGRRSPPPSWGSAAGPRASTRAHRRSPAPGPAAARPERSGGHAALVSGLSWIGAAAPGLGPRPPDAEPQQRLADGLPAPLAGDNALRHADRGGPLQGPQAAGRAKGAGTARQARAQPLGVLGGEDQAGAVGARGLFLS